MRYNKITWAICLILTCLGAYIGVASLTQLQAYETVLVGYTSRINALQEQNYRLQEEDRELNVRLDLATNSSKTVTLNYDPNNKYLSANSYITINDNSNSTAYFQINTLKK